MKKQNMKQARIKKTAVIGAGSWGTALAKLLADKGETVTLWGHRPEHLAQIEKDRENRRYLAGFPLSENLILEKDLATAVGDADCVVMVVPSHGYRQVFVDLLPFLTTNTLLVSSVKGIEVGTHQTMTQLMAEEAGSQAKKFLFGVLSGPSFAKEVAQHQPTAVTVAFADIEAARAVQYLFASDYFRAYTSTDVLGLEISGAMKNVIAIAAGISDGLGFGLNTRAALITRGLAEITRIGVAMGADPFTFSGLGGMGDLVLTCTGSLSRNRTVGLKLGEGKNLSTALSEMTMVAEGVKTTKSCFNLAAKLGVEMPILEQTYQVLYEGKDCRVAVQELFRRDLKTELDQDNYKHCTEK